MKLINLIVDCRNYLEYFNRSAYKPWFEKYLELVKPVLAEVEDVPSAVSELLNGLEEVWTQVKPGYRRNGMIEKDKLLICCFLNPALIVADEEKGSALAEGLREEWIRRYPKDQYRVGTYEFIMKGFEPRIFGFLLNRNKD